MFEKLSIMNRKFKDELQNSISGTDGGMLKIGLIPSEVLFC
jgi:hypothetical protein